MNKLQKHRDNMLGALKSAEKEKLCAAKENRIDDLIQAQERINELKLFLSVMGASYYRGSNYER